MAYNEQLAARIRAVAGDGPERFEEALAAPGARPMDFTGRPMKGMVFVGPEGYRTDDQLRAWVEQTLDYARSLPAKQK